ncbi:unnamed protein product [Coffea canephora]|uniref:Uncharacterized protein n=1 Tax=Coffea canephora TaxID=49390 RepID=A0A068ULW2_COFCA|nr:unnamed protein product [Coffea canephora]
MSMGKTRVGRGGPQSWPDLEVLPLAWLTDPGSSRGPHRKCHLNYNEQITQVWLSRFVNS